MRMPQPSIRFKIVSVVKHALLENPCVLLHSLFFLNPFPFFYCHYASSLIAFKIHILSVLQCIHLPMLWASPKICCVPETANGSFVFSVLVLCFVVVVCWVFFFSRSFFPADSCLNIAQQSCGISEIWDTKSFSLIPITDYFVLLTSLWSWSMQI